MIQTFVGIALVLALLAPLVLVVVVEVVFRRDDVGRLWRRVLRLEKRLAKRVEGLRGEIDASKRRFRDLAHSYEHGYIRRILRRRPIRDLRPYLSVSMSWSALEDAGITDLEKFVRFRGDFERIHGIGESRNRGLREAKRKLCAELSDTTLPMPKLRPPGTLDHDVLAAGLRTVELHEQPAELAVALKAETDELKTRRPGRIGVRWRFVFGERDELEQRLRECVELAETLVEQRLSKLVRLVEQAGADVHDRREFTEKYRRYEQPVKAMLDDATRRQLRGKLRPVGAAAMRAAEGFDDEEDFCDRALEPLIADLGYRHRREHTIKQRVGSRKKTMYVDFLLLDDNNRPVGVLEAKRSIRTDNDLKAAREQGLSYALFEQLEPVLVAAPEGLWVYERDGQQLILHADYQIEEAFEQARSLRQLVDRIAGRTPRGAQRKTAQPQEVAR